MTNDGTFESLIVWKKAVLLRIEIYDVTKQFPSEEKFILTSQILRSSRSIASNIVEGHGRYTYKEKIHFCRIARGSLSETLNHLINARECGYINDDQLSKFRSLVLSLQKILNGYIFYLKSQQSK